MARNKSLKQDRKSGSAGMPRSTLFPYTTLFRSAEAVKILIFAAEGLTKRSAVGFLLRSLIMFQTFISRHNSNFFSDKLVLTSVTPASQKKSLNYGEK